jgi:hypothetical protein
LGGGDVKDKSVIVPLEIVQSSQTVKEFSWRQVRHSSTNPAPDVGADIDPDIEIVSELLQRRSKILIENGVAIRGGRQRKGCSRRAQNSDTDENTGTKNSF